MCEFYSRLGRNKYTLIRHSNIYGPNDKFDLKKSHVFGASLNKVVNCKNNFVNIWGDGKESRDLLYISDLINFFFDQRVDGENRPRGIGHDGGGADQESARPPEPSRVCEAAKRLAKFQPAQLQG